MFSLCLNCETQGRHTKVRLPLVHGPDLSGGKWPRTLPVFICIPCGGEAWPYDEHGTWEGKHFRVKAIAFSRQLKNKLH